MDEKNLYHNDNTENAFEQAARQQAALQEEQAQLREAQPLMKEEICPAAAGTGTGDGSGNTTLCCPAGNAYSLSNTGT